MYTRSTGCSISSLHSASRMHLRAIEPLREFGTRPLPEFDPKPMIAALNEHGVRYVVIGAVAAIAQGYPLNTGDLDVTPARDPANVERLADTLRALDARLRVPGNDDGVDFPIDAHYLSDVDSWTLI